MTAIMLRACACRIYLHHMASPDQPGQETYGQDCSSMNKHLPSQMCVSSPLLSSQNLEVMSHVIELPSLQMAEFFAEKYSSHAPL